MTDRMKKLEAQVDEIHRHIVGSPGQDGIVTRLAKVEQRQSLFARIFAALGSVLLGLGVWMIKDKS